MKLLSKILLLIIVIFFQCETIDTEEEIIISAVRPDEGIIEIIFENSSCSAWKIYENNILIVTISSSDTKTLTMGKGEHSFYYSPVEPDCSIVNNMQEITINNDFQVNAKISISTSGIYYFIGSDFSYYPI